MTPLTTTGMSTAGVSTIGVSTIGVSTVELSLRMGVALAVVLSVLTVLTGLTKKRFRSNPSTALLQVCQQQQITKHTTITLLQAGTQHLLIATNPETTTLLATGPDLTTTKTPDPGTGTGTGPGGRAIDIRNKPNPLKQLQNKTVRRS